MADPLKIAAVLVALFLGVRSAAWGAAPKGPTKVFPYPVHQTVLENGLKVVAVPFDSPGVIAYWTVVRVGSRNEIEAGKSGFAHFFEHMMFRGTERYSRERYNAVFRDLGADHNAFTSDDVTAYHILAPASSLETLMTVESDRFMNLKYSEEDFKKEAGAILGEYNKNASNPFYALNETMRDTAFTTHTYKHSTMGYLRDIQAMPEQYAFSLKFFDRFYRPENCVLLVVGDVDPDRLAALARTHYGPWKKGTHRFRVAPEPPGAGAKKAHVPWSNPTEPYLYVAYRAPAFSTTGLDMPALDIAYQLVFSEAAPLYQKLVVDEQEVDLLLGGPSDHRDPHLFDIIARVKKPERVAYVEAAIAAALEEMKQKPVDVARLDQVKSHMRYAYGMQLDTASAVAASLAHYLQLTGDPEAVNQVYALYDRVTPETVRTVARKYFVPSGRTVVTLGQGSGPEAKGGA
jgi:zinc protease